MKSTKGRDYMCEICRQSPCHPRCPNAPDPPMSCYCTYCCEPIYVGEEYMEIDGDKYHEECLKGAAEEIVMDMATRGIAEDAYEDCDY